MRKILVIDDEKAVSDILSQVLNRFGFNVDTAENGREGMLKFDETIFDLVITDICMDGADGNDVVRHIRNSCRKTTPIIGISGTPWLMEDRAFDAVLSKPFSLRALADTVKDLTEATPGQS